MTKPHENDILFEVEGLKLLKITKTDSGSYLSEIIPINKNSGLELHYFKGDKEVAIEENDKSIDKRQSWIKHLMIPSDYILLASNLEDFLEAQRLQYLFRFKNGTTSRIMHPVVLNALWILLSARLEEKEEIKISFGKYVCECATGDDVIEIQNIYETEHSLESSMASFNNILKARLFLHKYWQACGKDFDFLLLDVLEYSISVVIITKGIVRDYIPLIDSGYIPTRKCDDIPCDLVKISEIYLEINHKRIEVDLKQFMGEIADEGNINITIEVDVNKTIKLTFDNNGNKSEYLLGEIMYKE